MYIYIIHSTVTIQILTGDSDTYLSMLNPILLNNILCYLAYAFYSHKYEYVQ